MAASWTTGLPIDVVNHPELAAGSIPQSTARRRVSREAGLAMRVLGRAIEHLSEEAVHEDDFATARKGEIKAVKILMTLNSQIYAECPAIPPMRERLGAFLHRLGM